MVSTVRPGWASPPLPNPDAPHPASTAGLDFDAILLRPSEGPAAQKPPLVVMPHGKSLPLPCSAPLCPLP